MRESQISVYQYNKKKSKNRGRKRCIFTERRREGGHYRVKVTENKSKKERQREEGTTSLKPKINESEIQRLRKNYEKKRKRYKMKNFQCTERKKNRHRKKNDCG